MAAPSDKEKLAALRLIRTENIGPITYNRLVERFGSAERALNALPELAARGGKSAPLKAFPADAAAREIENIQKLGARLVMRGDTDYPALLAEIEDAPPLITVRGQTAWLSKPSLGIVGARNASLVGKKIAETFARQVSMSGYVVTSGLARGIDSAAHQAALPGGTVAVVAGGIDVVYPPENRKLYDDIAARGAIVAESPFGTEPIARHFPRRNRIISGLSLGVLIVEAAEKSGSLITARMAAEQNREVFAVPGSPLDPRAGGTNSLLKDGAHMAATAEDILQVLNSLRLRPLRESAGSWTGAPAELPLAPANEKLRDMILENLSPVPVPLDELIRAVSAPPGEVLGVILELEIAGRIERQPGNKVNLI